MDFLLSDANGPRAKGKGRKKKLGHKKEVAVFENSKRDTNNDNNVMKLPGGFAWKTVVNEVPDTVAYRIRAYLDELFGTIMLQVKESNSCFDAIPVVVNSILKYNNIQFETVDMINTRINTPEPLWFKFEIDKRHLTLYLNENMYNDYCTNNVSASVPVVWSCGHIAVENYNPYRSHPEVSDLDTAKIKCALVCDHVAQHIIHRYYKYTPLLTSAELHDDGWTKIGTTLHSMLDIEIVESPLHDQYRGTVNQVLTMLPPYPRTTGGPSLGLISSREYTS